jgi:hypothetical protein
MTRKAQQKKHEALLTDNYDMFVIDTMNRRIKPNNLRRARHLLEPYGWDPTMPMVVVACGKGQFSIKDGQHRFIVSRDQLQIPVWYSVTPNKEITALDMSGYQTAWGISDYIDFYMTSGKSEYDKLYEFMRDHRLPAGVAAGLLSGIGTTGGHITELVKSGEFTIVNEQKAKEVAQLIGDIKTLFPHATSRYGSASLWACCLVEGFDPKHLVKQCRRHQSEIVRQGSIEQYLDMWQYRYLYRWPSRKAKLPLKMRAMEAWGKRTT